MICFTYKKKLSDQDWFACDCCLGWQHLKYVGLKECANTIFLDVQTLFKRVFQVGKS